MIDPKKFLDLLSSKGFGPFIGVPCSFIKPLINCAINSENLEYLPANNEGEAVAIGTGAYLAGKRPVIMMQNSGLGNCVSPLTSLNFVYRIPLLLIVTLRGEPGLKDEPQHELMGRITVDLLNLMKVENGFFPADESQMESAVNTALDFIGESKRSYAFVMRKNSVKPLKAVSETIVPFIAGKLIRRSIEPKAELHRAEAISIVSDILGSDTLIVSTTGKISRELFELSDRENQFYVVGSMGCASSIGLGLAMYQAGRRVAVLDGDGAALMRLESWVSTGHFRPHNYIYVVLDNESYESTGGQRSLSPSVDFSAMGIASGFASALTLCTKSELVKHVQRACESPGPHLLHVKVKRGSNPNLGRPTVTPIQVKERFMNFIAAYAGQNQ